MNIDNKHCSEMESYDYYILGEDYRNKKEYYKAIKYFLLSLKKGMYYKTYERLYECYKGINQKDTASYYLTLAYNANSKSDKVSFAYAKVLIDKNELNKAKEVLLKILKRNPSYKKAKILYENIDNCSEP